MLLQLLIVIVSFLFIARFALVLHNPNGLWTFTEEMKQECPPFDCGEMKNISCPFKPQGSKSPGFELICQDNTTLMINLTQYYSITSRISAFTFRSKVYNPIRTTRYQHPRYQGIFNVKDIPGSRIQIVDPNFASHNSSISSACPLPLFPLGGDAIRTLEVNGEAVITWVRCKANMSAHDPAVYLPVSCLDDGDNNNSFSSSSGYAYLLPRKYMTVESLDSSCHVLTRTPTIMPYDDWKGLKYAAVLSQLQMGFAVDWPTLCSFCDLFTRSCPDFCYGTPNQILGFLRSVVIGIVQRETYIRFVVPRILAVIFLLLLLIYKIKQKYSPVDNVDKLLRSFERFMPRRYSYVEIKIITGHFREKLGQGGFGSVFKGRLFDGRLVAVKLLGKTNTSGQDFINEVSTIGRVHHVNVVRLVGFCSEGSARALVYEFMPNGSLDRYIFPGKGRSHLLSWEKLYEIALGIARGIDYLHRGCDMCILHFDIKPQNILLDENFCPKISDFGLAKLSASQNTLALSGLRGTIGYIAPEQVTRNFGGVSHKSDVYSFGQLLLEMSGRRKKVDALAPGSSQIYFPTWIYDRLRNGEDVEIGDATEFEEEIMKKLAIVGLRCIQIMPASRPSMSEAIEMLEGSLDALQLPPKSFLLSPD